MFLDDELVIPPDGDMEIPGRDMFAWMPTKHLRPFDFQDPDCQLVCGYGTVQKFCARLKTMSERSARREGLSDEDNEKIEDVHPRSPTVNTSLAGDRGRSRNSQDSDYITEETIAVAWPQEASEPRREASGATRGAELEESSMPQAGSMSPVARGSTLDITAPFGIGTS
ncbi:hypothetical protein NKR23_g12443 [Pleurostoma richardsiae]|uniref:Uncharacterized protein n=1 Tax=Pleurostoma richardsiae TaxID=41990 RepID=A0AA38R7W1_9PEZI|nr:hypothetical protein NKR23_g12443 [Pleurostoma richardsiae]